jgi:hypothetical protein
LGCKNVKKIGKVKKKISKSCSFLKCTSVSEYLNYLVCFCQILNTTLKLLCLPFQKPK